MALTIQANPPVPEQAHIGIGRLFRISPVGVVCALASGLLNSAFYALTPLYLRQLNYATGQVAAFASVVMIAGLAVQVPAGWLADRLGRRRVTVAVLAASLVVAVALILSPPLPFVGLAALGFAFAAATAPLYGLGAGQVNDRMERGDYVAASGALLFTWSVGSSAGPGLAGAVIGLVGPAGLFLYLGIVVAATALFTVGRVVARPGVAADRRTAPILSLVVPARSLELAARTMHTLRHHAEAPALRALLHRRIRL
jgi:MFS family permease